MKFFSKPQEQVKIVEPVKEIDPNPNIPVGMGGGVKIEQEAAPVIVPVIVPVVVPVKAEAGDAVISMERKRGVTAR